MDGMTWANDVTAYVPRTVFCFLSAETLSGCFASKQQSIPRRNVAAQAHVEQLMSDTDIPSGADQASQRKDPQ